jgi:hypothetical protein
MPQIVLSSNWGTAVLRCNMYTTHLVTGVEYFVAASWRDNDNGTLDMTIYLRQTDDLTGANAYYSSGTVASPGAPRKLDVSQFVTGYAPYGATPNGTLGGGINLIQVYAGDFQSSKTAYETLYDFVQQGRVETPTFSPNGGTFSDPATVTISCATSGATIRYTTDGNDPTETTGTVIVSGGTVLISDNVTLKAKAWATGLTPSFVKSAAFTISSVPIPSLEATYNANEDLTIGVPSTGGLLGDAEVAGGKLLVPQVGVSGVFYGPSATNWFNMTNDGSWGTNTIAGIFTLDTRTLVGGLQTLAAIGTEDPYTHTYYTASYGVEFNACEGAGMPQLRLIDNWGGDGYSALRCEMYSQSLQTGVEYFVAASWRDNDNGTLDMTIYLRQTDDLTGTNAYYSTGTSTNPGHAHRLPNSYFFVGQSPYGSTPNGTLGGSVDLVQVYGGAFQPSKAAYETFYDFVRQVRVETPTFSPNGGTFGGSTVVTISCATGNATIRYTTDGSNPTETNGTIIASGGTITVSQSLTLKAKAWADGLAPSLVRSAAFSLKTATPTLSPHGGAFALAQNVVVSCTTPGVTIRYTTDGVDPTESTGTVIASGATVLVSDNVTLKAKAWKTGYDASDLQSASFTFPTSFQRPTTIYRGTAAVDANLADWSDAQWTPLSEVYNGTPTDIAEGYYAAKWDPNGNKIYVAAKVRDTSHKFLDSYTAWDARDAIEIYIHTNGTGSTSYYSTNQDTAQEYTVGIKDTNRLTVWKAVGNGFAVPISANFQAAGQEVGDWLYYEAAITPFEFFGGLLSQPNVLSPVGLGYVIGLDVCAVGNNGTYTGMRSENLMTGKSGDYNQFGLHRLISIVGDVNADNVVNGVDTGIMSTNWGMGPGAAGGKGDVNGDGFIDSVDLDLLADNWGASG